MKKKSTVVLNGQDLTIENIINVARNNYKVEIDQNIKKKLVRQREQLENQINNFEGISIYGANRLHGDLKDEPVAPSLIGLYQIKFLMVHNCGTGNPLPEEEVRAIMLIRLNSFARGMSGMRLATCQLMLDMLNTGLTPWVLEEGSVGASGDLVPLAMIGATMIEELQDESKAYYKGELLTAREAFQKAGLQPTVLGAKEAMGLTNGSNFIAGIASLALYDAEQLLLNASISASLSLEAIRGEQKAFGNIINENSNRHSGQVKIAQQIRNLVKGSGRMSKEAQEAPFGKLKKGSERVQDRYSYRAIPQVHGTSQEALQKLRETLTQEINSSTDNPLFDFDKKDSNTGGIAFASGANFHGQPLATVIDYVKIALTSLALMTDKRTFALLDKHLSYGLPGDLAYDTKRADGGLMITQYAGAARVAECRILASPASVMSVSTAANQEDFVSMGSIGVLHLKKILYNLEVLIGIELLCALRGIQMTYEHLPEALRKLGLGSSLVYHELSKEEHFPIGENKEYLKDHYLRTDMEKAIELVKSGQLIGWVGDILKE